MLSYYFVEASYNDFPALLKMDTYLKIIMTVQLTLGVFILIINVISFKYCAKSIKYLLFLQAIQTSLSNFDKFEHYRELEVISQNG